MCNLHVKKIFNSVHPSIAIFHSAKCWGWGHESGLHGKFFDFNPPPHQKYDMMQCGNSTSNWSFILHFNINAYILGYNGAWSFDNITQYATCICNLIKNISWEKIDPLWSPLINWLFSLNGSPIKGTLSVNIHEKQAKKKAHCFLLFIH